MYTGNLGEVQWEHKLGIATGTSGYEREDRNHSRYEPTPYAVLERLTAADYISRNDVLVDYGCGKGRVSFFLNYTLGCRCIGVEYSETVFECAQANLASYSKRGKNADSVHFVCMSAEQYDACEANRFYFFQSVFSRHAQGRSGTDIGFLLRLSAGNAAVFLLSAG